MIISRFEMRKIRGHDIVMIDIIIFFVIALIFFIHVSFFVIVFIFFMYVSTVMFCPTRDAADA